MKSWKPRGIVTPVNLREVYAEMGEYDVKMLIDPAESTRIETVDVRIRNADGKPMEFTSRRWGTKLNMSFMIDRTTPDGVSVIEVRMRGRVWSETTERFNFWVFK